jgi:hypothetical protein
MSAPISDIRREQKGEWFFAVRPLRHGDGYAAWCAKTADLGDGPMAIPASEEVHFEFGRSTDEALEKLYKEVLS